MCVGEERGWVGVMLEAKNKSCSIKSFYSSSFYGLSIQFLAKEMWSLLVSSKTCVGLCAEVFGRRVFQLTSS